jgi:hypothetical protein
MFGAGRRCLALCPPDKAWCECRERARYERRDREQEIQAPGQAEAGSTRAGDCESAVPKVRGGD